jgi:hypothetical protein
MKSLFSIIIAALCVIVFLSSCKNDSTPSKESAVDSQQVASPNVSLPAVNPTTPSIVSDPTAMPSIAAPGVTTPTPKAEPPQNAKGVWHYTCSKGCAGGAGTAEPCAKCGTLLAHNTKYHGDTPAAAPTAAAPNANQPAAPSPTPKPEPPQNAKGVWHYTCADGCAGGAGATSPCSKCNKPLAHNPAYHQ